MIISLDFSSDIPIYLQLRNQIVIGISCGALKPGEKLPTTRGLADEIGINTMTVNKAYQLLKQEGYITADRRKGAIVSHIKHGGLSYKARESIVIAASEAKLNGMTREEFIDLCSGIFDNDNPMQGGGNNAD